MIVKIHLPGDRVGGHSAEVYQAPCPKNLKSGNWDPSALSPSNPQPTPVSPVYLASALVNRTQRNPPPLKGKKRTDVTGNKGFNDRLRHLLCGPNYAQLRYDRTIRTTNRPLSASHYLYYME